MCAQRPNTRLKDRTVPVLREGLLSGGGLLGGIDVGSVGAFRRAKQYVMDAKENRHVMLWSQTHAQVRTDASFAATAPQPHGHVV